MISYQQASCIINNEINKIVYDNSPKSLYEPISYILSLEGKRVRPVLTLLAYNLYKDDVEEVIPTALGWEIFHNFTLLHDDLMDKANMRRGQLTVHKKWNDNMAILSGDAMLILAYQYIAKTPVENLKIILDLFSQTADEICRGQQYDMEFESRLDVTECEYIEMIRLKTAVMLGACLKTGAIIAGATAEDADLLYDFGINIGLAFQIKDDWLDTYGDPLLFGKNIGGDILCNKKTYLLVNALDKSQGKEKELLLYWLSATENYDRDEKIKSVTEIYDSLKLKEITEKKMNFFYDKAVSYLSLLNMSKEKTIVLYDLAKNLMNRNI